MRGQDCKTFYNSDSSDYSSPTWVEVERVVSDTIEPTGEEITGANRSSEYGSTDVGTKRFSGTVTYEYDDGDDTVYLAFRTAWANNSVVDMLFLDAAYSTGSGYRAPMKVTGKPVRRDLDSVVQVEISLASTVWDDSDTLREPTGWAAGSDASL